LFCFSPVDKSSVSSSTDNSKFHYGSFFFLEFLAEFAALFNLVYRTNIFPDLKLDLSPEMAGYQYTSIAVCEKMCNNTFFFDKLGNTIDLE